MATEKTKKLAALIDGLAESRYPGHKKWPMQRWAWEFLRRNETFIAACDEALSFKTKPRRQEAQGLVALLFGLSRFKHHAEDYGKGRRPKFSVSGVYVYSNTDQDDPREIPLTSLRKGEVVIRFNLLPSLADERALRAQIKQAAMELRAKRRKLLKALPASEPAEESAGQDRLYSRHLCVLDLLREEGGVTSTLRVLREDRDTPGYLLREDGGRALVSDAVEFAESRYLAVALGKVKKKRKSSQITKTV